MPRGKESSNSEVSQQPPDLPFSFFGSFVSMFVKYVVE
jgi:hypothetical protein